MLRIFHTHPARTSLLQDFAFYEVRNGDLVFGLVFISLAASSDAEDAGKSAATRGNIRWSHTTITISSPTTGYVLDEHGEHGEHPCYVRRNVAGHGWCFVSAFALYANGDGHDEPTLRYAADSGHAPECHASPQPWSPWTELHGYGQCALLKLASSRFHDLSLSFCRGMPKVPPSLTLDIDFYVLHQMSS